MKIRQVAVAFLTLSAALARAEDVSTKSLSIKDKDPLKRQISVSSADLGISYTDDADDPGTNGAQLHVYSATDNFCADLEPGLNWKDTGSKWKYKNKLTRNSAQIKDGKLSVKIKSNITYTLDEIAQGAVNVQVQFGSGTRFCMRCPTGNKKDEPGKYGAKACLAAACDAEPACPVPTTTTTSSTTTSSTTTTCPPGPPPLTKLKGALSKTAGRFNYNLAFGLPAADSACNTNFPGTHACTYQELQVAAAACDLVGLTAPDGAVSSFWAIDNGAPILTQCNDDDPMVGSGLNWEYQTAHTGSRGNHVSLNNVNGSLGPLQSGQQCNFTTKNVGCCVP
jgi:hypothetical protein